MPGLGPKSASLQESPVQQPAMSRASEPESPPTSEAETATEAFEQLLAALQEHQSLAFACVQQQEKVIHAMSHVQLDSLSALCRRYAIAWDEDGLAGSDGGHQSRSIPNEAGPTRHHGHGAKAYVLQLDGQKSRQLHKSENSRAGGQSPTSPHQVKSQALFDSGSQGRVIKAASTDGGEGSRSGMSSGSISKSMTGSMRAKRSLEGEPSGSRSIHRRTNSYVAEESGEEPYDPHKRGMKWSRPIRRFIASRGFELISTAVMLLNVIAMIVRLELDGRLAGHEIGAIVHHGVNEGLLDLLDEAEVFFTMWFTIELLLRIWTFGCSIFTEAMNIFDSLVVLGTLLDLVLTRFLNLEGGMNISIARMMRMVKVLKFLRTFKAASAFTELRILLRTVMRSTMALLWALIVLTMIILTCSNFMAQLLHGYITDKANPPELREEIFELYGTASRAAWTMLEATLSGGWPNYARVLVVEVSPIWAAWWFFYVFVVIFAVIRVMGALFLTASLKAASEDEDMQALRRQKENELACKLLRDVFRSDEVIIHDLHVSRSEREAREVLRRDNLLKSDMDYVLKQQTLVRRLNNYGYEAIEFRLLYDIIAGDEEKIPWKTFERGCMRLKGGVKAIDIIEILHEIDSLKMMLPGLEMLPLDGSMTDDMHCSSAK